MLFPFVGGVKNKVYRHEGKEYPMNQHGFARDSQFRCVNLQQRKRSFLFCSNEETREVYPYDFELYITYRLDGKIFL